MRHVAPSLTLRREWLRDRLPSTPPWPACSETDDRQAARPWVLTVVAMFVLIFILALAGIPSRLIPQPTAVPLPSVPAPSASIAPSGSG